MTPSSPVDDEGGSVTHDDIRAALVWQRWAIVGLAGVGAFAILTLRGQLVETTAAMNRVEYQVGKSVDNLAGTISTTNSVLQSAVVRLEGVSAMVERHSDEMDRHQALSSRRAHGDEEGER